jgi:para-aminobenzoate synthetase component 1
MTRGQYVSAVQRALEYIAAGDIYQVNLSQRFSAEFAGDASALFERVCETNPASYAAYMAWPDADGNVQAVLSSSPELFLQVRADQVITRPIKGTRPRGGDETDDATMREALRNSEKDKAELAMIVDLERNDLGRVCEFGSVRVTEPRSLEAHPTVWHAVGQVEGRLRADCSIADLIRATFPGGSITGAPKVRAMQIIEELEPTARSVYCGAVGYVGLNGDLTLNLPIRTMVLGAGRLHVQVGAGIVADSQPEAEYAETLAKAEGMLRALGVGVDAIER